MRESIGATFLLNFIILFVFLVFAFLAGTLSYYRAFRINNVIIHAIEMFEGYNEMSRMEISRVLSGWGYDMDAGDRYLDSGCPPTRVNNSVFSHLGSTAPQGVRHPQNNNNAYCVYVYNNDMAVQNSSDIYFSYGVLTFMHLRLPVFEHNIMIPVFAKTNRMYDFEDGRLPVCLNGQSPAPGVCR